MQNTIQPNTTAAKGPITLQIQSDLILWCIKNDNTRQTFYGRELVPSIRQIHYGYSLAKLDYEGAFIKLDGLAKQLAPQCQRIEIYLSNPLVRKEQSKPRRLVAYQGIKKTFDCAFNFAEPDFVEYVTGREQRLTELIRSAGIVINGYNKWEQVILKPKQCLTPPRSK